MHTKFLLGVLKRRYLFKEIRVDGRIILNWMLNIIKGYELNLSDSGHKKVAGCCEHVTEPLGSIKCREFLDQLSEYYVLKKNSFYGVSLVS
jgi:hypothetical protein